MYFDVNDLVVRKLISLKHYNTLRLALDRIIIHNAVFPYSALKVFGYGKNQDNRFVVMAEQPYIRGVSVSSEERCRFMHEMGFEDAGED